MSSRGMFVVPLKFICSTQCETPVTPGVSSLEPTRYQHHTETSGAVRTSFTTTVRPLSRTAVEIPSVSRWVDAGAVMPVIIPRALNYN